MTVQNVTLTPGLYFVATPIGNARDITLRALDVLSSADVLAAEDTRTLRKLMEIHGISLGGRSILPYHDHNGPQMRPKILALVAEGKSVAYTSEAGTPLVADPGFVLGREAIAQGLPVTSAPGASAIIDALTIAGLPTDRFLFAGFLPPASGARKTFLKEMNDVPATLVFYESPKRIQKTLADMCEVFGSDRQVSICRELTKKFEEVLRGTVTDLMQVISERPLKGEIVIVVDRDRREASDEDLDSALAEALGRLRVKDAAAEVAEKLGLPRRQVYQAALARAGKT